MGALVSQIPGACVGRGLLGAKGVLSHFLLTKQQEPRQKNSDYCSIEKYFLNLKMS